MLTITPRRLIYSSLILAGLLALGFGGLGLVRAAGNSQAADERTVCRGLGDALALVELATELDIGDDVRDELQEVLDDIEDAIDLEEDGEFDRAMELKGEIVEVLMRLAETDNADLSALLLDALIVLEPCVAPVPGPDPQPASHFVYSAKFVCGRNTNREPMVTPNFGRQPFLFDQQTYQTEINIHNFRSQRVVVSGQALVANSHDEPRGPMSELARRVLRPNEAIKVNCQDIAELLGDVNPEVCPGKSAALEILTNLLNRPANDVVSAEFMEAIKEVAVMTERAIALEEEGAFEEALELERQIVERLNELIDRAEEMGNRRLVRALTEARNLIRRCVLSAAGDVVAPVDGDADALSVRPRRLPKLVEGFVVINTPVQLEVTGVYRANSHNKTVSGGVGSGTSIDVEQISPHRVRGPIPMPADGDQ